MFTHFALRAALAWDVTGAPPDVTLLDVGVAGDGPPVLVVVTPGIDSSAYQPWIAAIEGRGLDAWTAQAGPGVGPDEVVSGLRDAGRDLASRRGPLRVAAHGYGGVFALRARLGAERMALVATPLTHHAAPLAIPEAAGAGGEGLPWPTDWVGALPAAPRAASIDAAYRGWAVDLPAPPLPGCPALLVAANLDIVAPPEVVRLPSQSWPDRTWERAGLLSLELQDPLHADLLTDPGVARRVARYLAE